MRRNDCAELPAGLLQVSERPLSWRTGSYGCLCFFGLHTQMNAAAMTVALVPASWLLPNHYLPWVSAWQEGYAIAVLAAAALLSRTPLAVPQAWAFGIAVALCSVVAQALSGQVLFAGDALMAALYLVAFAVALGAGEAALRGGPARGSRGAKGFSDTNDPALDIMALGIAAAAILSVGTALVQWTGTYLPRLWVVDLPPGARPFSNLAQPNNFCTAAFLGLAALAVLRESKRIGQAGFWIGAAFMLVGMVMSGSRMAWVQLALAVVLIAALGKRTAAIVSLRSTLGLTLLALAIQAGFSPLDALLSNHHDRPLVEKLSAGARPGLWRDMLAAVAQAPWLGHGWQQIGAAQQSVALDRPPNPAFFEHFDHAHNIVLDLLLWAGIPVGGLIAIICASALWSQLRRITDARALWLMVAVLGLVAHSLVELPLEFAYFLIPMGVALGMVNALSQSGATTVAVPRWVLPATGAMLAGTLIIVAFDYVRAEEDFRLARLQTARIGTDRVASETPDLIVLTQLHSYLRFVRTPARSGMSDEELAWMRKVAQRYGFAPVLFRSALALGLNGRPDEAARMLKLLCHVHSAKRCREAREAWPSLQERHAVLRAVAPP